MKKFSKDTYTSSYNATTEGLYNVGAQYTVTGNICFVARYRESDINLYDNKSNGETLNEYHGKKVSKVTLSGRTLYRDGRWNTLCLPFNVNAFDGSPLEGATVKTLSSTSFDNGTLTLNFSDNVTSIEAGKPYIVKWETTPKNITDPVFNNVTLSNTLNHVETTAAEGVTITFAGAYSPMFIGMERKNILYLGPDNKLYYPNGEVTIGSCRAHFRLQNIEASALNANAIVLNFDDENVTGIVSMSDVRGQMSDVWHTLDGRKLSGKPTQKGVYIVNGRKIVIK